MPKVDVSLAGQERRGRENRDSGIWSCVEVVETAAPSAGSVRPFDIDIDTV
jgi:hypothetical protein